MPLEENDLELCFKVFLFGIHVHLFYDICSLFILFYFLQTFLFFLLVIIKMPRWVRKPADLSSLYCQINYNTMVPCWILHFQVALSFYESLNEWDLSDYENNIEWDVIGHGAKYNEKYYPCCPEPYPDITFTLRIRRKALYYSYVYLGPAVLLALLAPFVFLLPPGNSQKMTLGKSHFNGFLTIFAEAYL